VHLFEQHQHLDMGWLRLVGSLKLQVSFAEYSLFYRALLQKRPIILRDLLIVATLYRYGITNSGFKVSFGRKTHVLEYPVPIPSNPLMTFRNGISIPGLGS